MFSIKSACSPALPFSLILNIFLDSGTDDPHVVQLTSYQNLQIFVIDGIIYYPGDLTNTFQANSQLSAFATFASSTQVPVWDTGSNSTVQISVTQDLDGVRGLTLFAPDNNAMGSISQLTGNTTQTWAVLRNHVINGTTVYSPSFDDSTYVSAAGENLHFTSNSSGEFVTSGNTTAQIVQPDVLTKNGVIHIIDRVLFNTDVNEGAASSAYSSATSAAAHSSTETGPVGVPTGGSSTKNTNEAVGKSGVASWVVVAFNVALGSTFLFA